MAESEGSKPKGSQIPAASVKKGIDAVIRGRELYTGHKYYVLKRPDGKKA